MNGLKLLALAILVPFLVLTGYAVSQVGYVGIFEYHFWSPAGWQVMTDLVIAVVLISLWMIQDARARGRNVWPYLAMNVFLGSIGILVYLLMAPGEATARVERTA